MKLFQRDYGGKKRAFEVPEENICAEMTMRDFPATENLEEAIREALDAPTGCEKLTQIVSSGDKVAILIPDTAPPSHKTVPLIVKQLNRAGVRDENITLVFATGMHKAKNYKEKIGQDLLERFKLIIHGWEQSKKREELKFIGITNHGTPVWVNKIVTEVDLVIGLGEISPNIFAGFCGGGKIILPGVAGKESIEQNHQLIMVPKNFSKGESSERRYRRSSRLTSYQVDGY